MSPFEGTFNGFDSADAHIDLTQQFGGNWGLHRGRRHARNSTLEVWCVPITKRLGQLLLNRGKQGQYSGCGEGFVSSQKENHNDGENCPFASVSHLGDVSSWAGAKARAARPSDAAVAATVS